MTKFISHSEKETKQFARNLAKEIKFGIVALSGELGAGKTTFVQGFAKGLGIKEKITSPTFVLIRQHQIPSTNKIFYHIDLYRLENKKDFKQLGLKDLLNDLNHLVVIEWAEKVKGFLPKTTRWIYLKIKDRDQREIFLP